MLIIAHLVDRVWQERVRALEVTQAQVGTAVADMAANQVRLESASARTMALPVPNRNRTPHP